MTGQLVQIQVSPRQMRQLEALWRICSLGRRRIAEKKWVQAWDSGVEAITGYAPDGRPYTFEVDACNTPS